jgi:hypothetical protein
MRASTVLQQSKRLWSLPSCKNKTGTWKMYAVPQSVVEGVLDKPKEAEVFAKIFADRMNRTREKGRSFAISSTESLRLPTTK